MVSDKDLLRIYMVGFNDELDGKHQMNFDTPIEQRAYEIGRNDAITGDDVTSNDSQSNETILKHIKRKIK